MLSPEAALRRPGPGTTSAVPMALVPLAASDQLAPDFSATLEARPRKSSSPTAPTPAVSIPTALQSFAPAAQPVLALGVARLTEYQNRAYADLYLQRMTQVLQAEQAVDPSAAIAPSPTGTAGATTGLAKTPASCSLRQKRKVSRSPPIGIGR